jgi:hypothetical protein
MDSTRTLTSTTQSRCVGRWMGRRAAVALAVIATAVCVPGQALAALPIRVPRIHLEPPTQLRIPAAAEQEIAAARVSASRYGTSVLEVENRLDATSADAVQAIHVDIAWIGRSAEVRARLRQCVTSGLQSTATQYGEAMVAQFMGISSDFPGVYESFQSAAYSCIGDQIDVPDDVIQHVATHLSRRVHGYFGEASAITESGVAQQRWLQLTAAEIANAGTEPGGAAVSPSGQARPDPPPATNSSDSSEVLLWLGGAALFLTAVLLVWRPWRRREGS